MTRWEVYSKLDCPFCEKAKELIYSRLRNRQGEFSIYDITNDPELKKELLERVPNAKTVPQIFFRGEHIGGYDDLVEYIDNTTSFG
jgi:glutaredoxin